VVVEEHIVGMGNRWGRRGGKREWGGKGEGGEVIGGFFRQKGNYQGDLLRGYQEDCATCSHIMSILYISCYCVYVVLIKECV
jgi:hypothetical protein